MLVFEQINKLKISEFMYCIAHNLLPPAFSGYFPNASDIYSYHTTVYPVKSSVAVLPEQMPVCFQLNVLVHVFGIIYLQTFAIFQA